MSTEPDCRVPTDHEFLQKSKWSYPLSVLGWYDRDNKVSALHIADTLAHELIETKVAFEKLQEDVVTQNMELNRIKDAIMSISVNLDDDVYKLLKDRHIEIADTVSYLISRMEELAASKTT